MKRPPRADLVLPVAPGRERRHKIARLGVAVGMLIGTFTACTTGSAGPSSSTPAPATRTVITGTRTPQGTTFTPAPATSAARLRGTSAPKGEKFARCPYIRTGLDQDGYSSGTTLANLEGDRVGHTTVLTGYTPVGCRFYFTNSYSGVSHEAVADILPTTFTTAAAAHNALVLTAKAGRSGSLQGQPQFVAGVDGIQYQTRFFGPDGDKDWAFAFAKGKVLVVVHTQQTDSPLNALLIGKAIVGKF